MDEKELTTLGEQITKRVDALTPERRIMLAKYVDILSRCLAAEDGFKAVLIVEQRDTIALCAVNADAAEVMGMVSFAQEHTYNAVMEGRPPKGLLN